MTHTANVVGIIVTLILASCDSDSASSTTVESSTKDEPVSATEASDPLEAHGTQRLPVRRWSRHSSGGAYQSPRRASFRMSSASISVRIRQIHAPVWTARPTALFDSKVGTLPCSPGIEVGLEASYELIDEDTFVTGPPDLFTVHFRIEGGALSIRIVKPLRQGPYIATWESAPWERE